MKKITFLTLLFLAFSNYSFSQIYKLRAYAIASSSYFDEVWEEWGEWEETNVLIVINSTEETCVIYSKTTQKLDLVESLGSTTENDGSKSTTWLYVDQDGDECISKLLVKDDIIQLYFIFDTFRVAYEVKMLD